MSAKASYGRFEAQSGSWRCARGADPRIAAVPRFVLSVSGLFLLLSVGMAVAQIDAEKAKPDVVVVPNVNGQALSKARETLAKIGLKVEVSGKTESDDVLVETVRGQDPAPETTLRSGDVVTLETLVPIVKVTVSSSTTITQGGSVVDRPPSDGRSRGAGLWVIVPILVAAALLGEGYRRLAKRRNRERDQTHHAMPGIEIHAVPDEGKQRLGRIPSAVSSLAFVVHPDNDGRQSVRQHRER